MTLWVKALRWLSFVALCLGMLYTVGNIFYKFGHADAVVECQAEKLKLQMNQIEEVRKSNSEKDRKNEDVLHITTQYHKGLVEVKKNADSNADAIFNGGLRDDLKNRNCVSTTDSSTGDSGTRRCGLQHTDVTDLIELARRADEIKEKLKACQGVIKAWKSNNE